MSLPYLPLLQGDDHADIAMLYRYLNAVIAAFISSVNEAVNADTVNNAVDPATFADGSVAFTKLPTVTASHLLGRGDSSDGAAQEINIGSNGLSLIGTTLDTSQVLSSGTYTPVVVILTNLDALTINNAQYLRVGNVVTVSGRFTADATAVALVEFTISLPIASVFTTVAQCAGTAFSPNVASLGAAIRAGITYGAAYVAYVPVDTASRVFLFTFTYLIS